MRLEIESQDRVGISQEILAVFASKGWSIVAMEVATNFIYVQIDSTGISLSTVKRSLNDVSGVLNCKLIELLPTEHRESHLKALLARIPDPILDVDAKGNILSSNKALISLVGKNCEGERVSKLLNLSDNLFVSQAAYTREVSVKGQMLIAEITPIYSNKVFNGAVIVLKEARAIGRQISLLQQQKQYSADSIIGQSTKINLLKQQMARFAELDLPVLITGETGTGKELFARGIHEASHRQHAPFLAINCAALPEHLLESELFGYAPGAYTGAQKAGKPGLFELADGGTVFLDEIAEMSTYLQAKLLRFLQDFRYRRLGGTEEFVANVRIISASHQIFTDLIQQKTFREDLYYRLNVLTLSLPSLRERIDDISILSNYFIANAARQVGQPEPKLNKEALALLQRYNWPGNIRQLQNILFSLVALNEKNIIEKEDVEHVLLGVNKSYSLERDSKNIDTSIIKSWSQAQSQFEKELLMQFYPEYPTTRKLAARLKVSHNKIAMKLREHHLLLNDNK